MPSEPTVIPLRALYDLAAADGQELRYRDKAGQWHVSRLCPAATLAILETRQWHKFIIGPDIPELTIPITYADQLRQHGLFRLPFDEVVMQYGPANKYADLDGLDPDELRAAPNEFTIAIIKQTQTTIEGRLFGINLTECPDLRVGKSYGHFIYPLNLTTSEWLSDPTLGVTLDPDLDDPPLTLADPVGYLRREKENFTSLAFTLVGLLNAEGIVDEHHPAPRFINKKREAKGKAPLFEYHVLKISPDLKMPGYVPAGGTHASPRLHWRRGHIRHLASGKLTQVRPCLVGNRSLGTIEKDYLITEPAS